MEFGANETVEEHDVDAILANVYGHGESSSQAGQESSPIQDGMANTEQAAPQFKEFEFVHNGNPIKIAENDPRMIKWLSQGHDYSQKMEHFDHERKSWEENRQNWEKNWSVYKEIDDFAKQNPDWWNQIHQTYEQKQQNPHNVPDEIKAYLDQKFKGLEDDIPKVKQFLDNMQRQELEKQTKEADTALERSIKEIQQKYSHIDFAAQDESGQSLEQRVLAHAMQNGFPTFRSAFLDYYHDNIEKMAELRGKESISQEMAKRQKLGLLDQPAPKKSASFQPSNGVKPRSWNDPSLRGESILKDFKFA